MPTSKIDIRTLLYACLAIVVVDFLGGIVASRTGMPNLPAIGIIRIIEISLLIMIVSRLDGGLATVGLELKDLRKKIIRGLVWSAGFGCLGGLLLLILHLSGLMPVTSFRGPQGQNPGTLAMLFLVGGLIAPMAEELFFRGIIYTFLRQWGITAAVAGSTVIFCLVHYLVGNLQMTHVIGGLAFALAFETEKNLIVPMMIHVLGNLAIFTLGLLV